MKSLKYGATLCAFASLALVGFDAAAATIRVTCEVRADRSKISVDANDLAAGSYSTEVLSGSNMSKSPPQRAVGGEIEADYDSNPADIAAGAVAIQREFIVGGKVTGKVVNGSGNTVISDTVNCRVRSR